MYPRFLLIPMFAAAAVACGDDASSGPPDGPLPDAAGAADCAAYAAASCARQQACGPGGFAIWHGTAAQCESAVAADCALRRDADGSGLTGGVLAGCIAELSTATCVEVLDAELSRCVARGARADGSACLVDEQCAGGNCRLERNSHLCGACTTLAAAGDPCSPDPDDEDAAICGPGLACAGSGTCVAAPIARAGESCVAVRCAGNLYCNDANVCVVPLAVDAPCGDLWAECDTAAGLFCDPELDRCVAVPISAAGGDCLPLGDPGGALCGPGLACNALAGLVCTAPLAAGAGCDRRYPLCGPGLACAADSTCAPRRELTCAGGTVDPGDEHTEPPPLYADIPGAGALTLDCAALTATLTFVARYANNLEVAQEARLGVVVVTLTGGLELAFDVSPTTSGELPPGQALAVTHTGTSAIDAAACGTCGESLASLAVPLDAGGTSQLLTGPATVTCALARVSREGLHRSGY